MSWALKDEEAFTGQTQTFLIEGTKEQSSKEWDSLAYYEHCRKILGCKWLDGVKWEIKKILDKNLCQCC